MNHTILFPDSSKILLIEPCNYTNAPMGGQLTGARMLMRGLGPRLALAGWTDDPSAPIGKWHTRIIDGVAYDFFATDCVLEPNHQKPLVPARLTSWWQFKRYGQGILSCGIKNILVREPTVMMALPFEPIHNVSYWFPGIEPALSVSRYLGAKYLASIFDSLFIKSLRRHAKMILAAADNTAIYNLRRRVGERLADFDIQFFPTRVDTDLFHPADSRSARQSLSLPDDTMLVVTSGRLHRAKGWPLLLEAVGVHFANHPNSLLIFVGDGSDKAALKQKIVESGLTDRVILVGHQPPNRLALYLQAANLFIMGSEKEGWSTSLVEALATGLPIVTTRFSSADTLVTNGVNGFVVDRDPKAFAQAMTDALKLEGVKEYSLNEVGKYALSNLEMDLAKIWPLL